MRHSIILKVGENLIYQQSPMVKPRPEISSTPVEYNRALPEWERTSTSVLIRPSDQKSFAEYIDKGGLLEGVKVPHELVEIYEDGDSYPKKKYARMKGGSPVIIDKQQIHSPEVNREALKYVEFFRDSKGELIVKCKNVSFVEMETAKEEFLEKEKRENGQPKDDADQLMSEIIPYCSTDGVDGEEQRENAKKIALIIVKKLMVEDALLNPKRLAHLEKVKTELNSL